MSSASDGGKAGESTGGRDTSGSGGFLAGGSSGFGGAGARGAGGEAPSGTPDFDFTLQPDQAVAYQIDPMHSGAQLGTKIEPPLRQISIRRPASSR